MTVKINGHHLYNVASYFYLKYGNPEKEKKAFGQFKDGVEEARKLHEKIKQGRQILVVEGPDDLCDICKRIGEFSCAYTEDGDSFVDDKKTAEKFGFEVGKTYALDDLLEKFPGLKKGWRCLSPNYVKKE